MRPSTVEMKSAVVLALVSRRTDSTTASAFLARWSTSRASSSWRSSASLRSVISIVPPLMRETRLTASLLAAAGPADAEFPRGGAGILPCLLEGATQRAPVVAMNKRPHAFERDLEGGGID